MPDKLKKRLLASARAYLNHLGFPVKNLRVTLRSEDAIIRIKDESGDEDTEVEDSPSPQSAMPLPGGLWLSPLEAKIVTGLTNRGWLTTAKLAEEIGEEPGAYFRAVITNLGERNIIETSQKYGLRIANRQDGEC